MCNSLSCLSSTSLGASSISDMALAVFGNAITYLMDFIPVISMTSLQSQGKAADLRAAGAVDVLMKPFTKAELKAAIEKFVK